MDIPGMLETAKPLLITFSLKVVGAIAAYVIGRMLIGFASNLVIKALQRQKVEPTVIRCIGSIITVALNIRQVYFDTNRTIRETFGAAGYPAAEAHLHVRQKTA